MFLLLVANLVSITTSICHLYLGCDTHNTSTENSGADLMVYIAFAMTCRWQPMNGSVFHTPQAVWFQFANPTEIERLIGLGEARS